MALVKKEDLLTMNIKIPRKLHDEVDELRSRAKKLNAVYDPAPRLIKALEKDLATTRREIEEAEAAARNSDTE